MLFQSEPLTVKSWLKRYGSMETVKRSKMFRLVRNSFSTGRTDSVVDRRSARR